MNIVDMAQGLQWINAALFWPIFWFMGQRFPGHKARSLTAAGFVAISTLTFFMGYLSPSEPDFFLAGSPDGQSRAMATFRPINDSQTRIELQAWRIDEEAGKSNPRVKICDPNIIDRCTLIWDDDSRTVRLVNRHLVLDLDQTSSVLELEVPQ